MAGRKSTTDELIAPVPATTANEPDPAVNEVPDTNVGNARLEARIAELEAQLSAATAQDEDHASENDPMALVAIQLPKDDQNYKLDLPVAVNGKIFIIQRGVRVMVPRYIAEIIKNSAHQDKRTLDLIEQLKTEYDATAKALT